MADYCKQCSIRIFGTDMGEMAGLSTHEDTNNGMYAQALCEGCGPTLVDHEGNCRYIDCLHKHGTAEKAPATLQNLSTDDLQFLVYCLGYTYAGTSTVDEATRNYVKSNHDRVIPKISAALLKLGAIVPNVLLTTDDHQALPASIAVVATPVKGESRNSLVDDLMYRLAQPVVDDICAFVKQNKLDEAKQLVVEHASVSPEIAQQFIDCMVRDYQEHSGSEPT